MSETMQRLAILGASGHGKVAADIATQRGWETIVFYDDAWPDKTVLEGWLVVGTSRDLLQRLAPHDAIFVAIGNNQTRSRHLARLLDARAPLATLIHPAAILSPFATLGAGVMLMAGAIVNAFASLDRGCIVNTGASVGHDCVLGECVHLAPGVNIGGGTCIGDRSWIGIGSAVRQGIQIGKDVMVGAGTVVVGPVDDDQTVVGVPARPLTEKT